MNLKFAFLFIPIFLFATVTHAQKKKKNKGVEIIEFGDEGENSNDVTYGNYIIKTSPVSYLAGAQFVEVEKYITEYLSVQAGVGLTFKPLIGADYSDVLSALSDEDGFDQCDSEIWNDDICENYSDLDYRRYNIGFLLSGSVRLFFDDDAMDGGYFAFKLRYSKLNIDVQDVSNTSQSVIRLEDEWLPESVKRFDIVGHYGYQSVFSKLTAEYFVGLGARIQNETREDLGYTISGTVGRDERQLKRTLLRIEGGIRIGFQL